MTLKKYQTKRNFKHTPEPLAKKKSSKSKSLYVIQKHAASHLHYDLRLEMNGVLKSWAIPKGPSLDPNVKRLAVLVEDHPIDYGTFEGIIPKGQYGGGSVLLWDKGDWESEDKNVNTAFKNGNMKFVLNGKKLKGMWKLIRLKTDPKNWLLIKVEDKYARPENEYDVTRKKPLSVTSKRPIDKITHSPAKFKILAQIPETKMPTKITPQLATLVNTPPDDNLWLHEIKFDGYRLICFIKNNKIKLVTRNHQNWTSKFPHLVSALEKLNLPDIILDGELVALNNDQKTDFQLLQNFIHNKDDANLFYYVFDIIYYDRYDLSNQPILERKKILHKLISTTNSPVRYSDHIIGNGSTIFKKSCDLGLEGILSKRIDSRYQQKRTRNWLKVKCHKRQEFIIGGFTKPKGNRQGFGALFLGTYSKSHKLQYNGRVGTGFTAATQQSIFKLLKANETTKMPFDKSPPDAKNVTWVTPKLIAEVEFSEWTNDNLLRHPSFKGIRTNKSIQEVDVQKPQHTDEYPLTNPDRILYPHQGITKRDLATYYETIHDWILPYIINRPLTLLRCPDGEKKCFYQKHLHETAKKPFYFINIKEHKSTGKYVYIKDLEGLMALVQLGVLEIHPWGSRIDNIEKPDVITFDLDPAPDVEWKKVIRAAHFIKEQLEQLNLQSFVKTTGGKGLHIVVPIKRKHEWSFVSQFCQTFVNYLVTLKPKEYVATMAKSKRTGKIFIDYLRNQRGATAVAAYSTRAKDYATVSTPLHWDELTARIKSDTFTIENLPKRLAKLENDPWEDFFKIQQALASWGQV